MSSSLTASNGVINPGESTDLAGTDTTQRLDTASLNRNQSLDTEAQQTQQAFEAGNVRLSLINSREFPPEMIRDLNNALRGLLPNSNIPENSLIFGVTTNEALLAVAGTGSISLEKYQEILGAIRQPQENRPTLNELLPPNTQPERSREQLYPQTEEFRAQYGNRGSDWDPYVRMARIEGGLERVPEAWQSTALVAVNDLLHEAHRQGRIQTLVPPMDPEARRNDGIFTNALREFQSRFSVDETGRLVEHNPPRTGSTTINFATIRALKLAVGEAPRLSQSEFEQRVPEAATLDSIRNRFGLQTVSGSPYGFTSYAVRPNAVSGDPNYNAIASLQGWQTVLNGGEDTTTRYHGPYVHLTPHDEVARSVEDLLKGQIPTVAADYTGEFGQTYNRRDSRGLVIMNIPGVWDRVPGLRERLQGILPEDCIPGVIESTGGAFVGKGSTRFDVAYDNYNMAREFSANGSISLIDTLTTQERANLTLDRFIAEYIQPENITRQGTQVARQ